MLSGAIFDRFQVKAPLARGGMGELWLAADADARDVVLKTVRSDLMDDDEVLGSFAREVRVTACLEHQNVVRHIAHGEWHGQRVLALGRIEGRNLAELAGDHGGALPVGAALCIARDIAEALSYVHHVRTADGVPLGAVHGDVSPQNILVDVDGNAHLIDFGAVKLADDPGGNDIIGKAGYLSPEQSRGDVVDARSDQYSLGVVLWELVTGGDLFEGNAARRGRTIPRPTSVARVPGALDEIVLRMLAFEQGQRFADVADAGQALFGLASGVAPDGDSRAWLARAARASETAAARARLGRFVDRDDAVGARERGAQRVDHCAPGGRSSGKRAPGSWRATSAPQRSHAKWRVPAKRNGSKSTRSSGSSRFVVRAVGLARHLGQVRSAEAPSRMWITRPPAVRTARCLCAATRRS